MMYERRTDGQPRVEGRASETRAVVEVGGLAPDASTGLGPEVCVTSKYGVAQVQFENVPEMILDREAHEIGQRLRALAADGHTRLLVDLAGVEYASSVLLADLAWLHRKVFEARGFLRLYGLTPVFRQVLRTCALDRVFELYETEAEALAAGDRASALVRFPVTEPCRTSGLVSP